MGDLKAKLLELEEEGIIAWNNELFFYYAVGGDPTEPFDLSKYIATVVPSNSYGRK